eukprot:TRINITY_DN56174_c0_g1_i1.p1 TRINITY_DN56174_c0_g1~~TRINITY_DN56174_c0_g1_i1.p1  ORF type:complete len:794 (+),score=111.50 TRINITY_DN56174_c0_g1_i1:111-2492(+)
MARGRTPMRPGYMQEGDSYHSMTRDEDSGALSPLHAQVLEFLGDDASLAYEPGTDSFRRSGLQQEDVDARYGVNDSFLDDTFVEADGFLTAAEHAGNAASRSFNDPGTCNAQPASPDCASSGKSGLLAAASFQQAAGMSYAPGDTLRSCLISSRTDDACGDSDPVELKTLRRPLSKDLPAEQRNSLNQDVDSEQLVAEGAANPLVATSSDFSGTMTLRSCLASEIRDRFTPCNLDGTVNGNLMELKTMKPLQKLNASIVGDELRASRMDSSSGTPSGDQPRNSTCLSHDDLSGTIDGGFSNSRSAVLAASLRDCSRTSFDQAGEERLSMKESLRFGIPSYGREACALSVDAADSCAHDENMSFASIEQSLVKDPGLKSIEQSQELGSRMAWGEAGDQGFAPACGLAERGLCRKSTDGAASESGVVVSSVTSASSQAVRRSLPHKAGYDDHKPAKPPLATREDAQGSGRPIDQSVEVENDAVTGQRRRGGVEVVVESPSVARQRLQRHQQRSASRERVGVHGVAAAQPQSAQRRVSSSGPRNGSRPSSASGRHSDAAGAPTSPGTDVQAPPPPPRTHAGARPCAPLRGVPKPPTTAGSSKPTPRSEVGDSQSGIAVSEDLEPMPSTCSRQSTASQRPSSVGVIRRASSASRNSSQRPGERKIAGVQSNRKLVRNALERNCLKGDAIREQRERILRCFDEELQGYERFVILFRSIHTGRHDLRALYALKERSWQRVLQELPSPPILDERMVAQCLRYDSGGKEFKEIPTQSEVLNVADAIFLHPQYLQKTRVVVQ